MFILTDLRVLLRETAPLHELDPGQKGSAQSLLAELQGKVDLLKEELLS
jgi:hypothetical protein